MSFRGTCLNPSCDAPGCYARAENPLNGKDYCSKHIGGRCLEESSVTDEQRLTVFRELVAYQYQHGQTHLDQAMYAYEREIKARIGGPR